MGRMRDLHLNRVSGDPSADVTFRTERDAILQRISVIERLYENS